MLGHYSVTNRPSKWTKGTTESVSQVRVDIAIGEGTFAQTGCSLGDSGHSTVASHLPTSQPYYILVHAIQDWFLGRNIHY